MENLMPTGVEQTKPAGVEQQITQAQGEVKQFLAGHEFGSIRVQAVGEYVDLHRALSDLTKGQLAENPENKAVAESNLRIAELEYVHAVRTVHNNERTIPGYRKEIKKTEELRSKLLDAYPDKMPLEEAQALVVSNLQSIFENHLDTLGEDIK